MATWRDHYRPLIAEVIERVGTSDMTKLRTELRKAFPSGLREYHPYKIWLDEIREQLGEKRKARSREAEAADDRAGQGRLFQ